MHKIDTSAVNYQLESLKKLIFGLSYEFSKLNKKICQFFRKLFLVSYNSENDRFLCPLIFFVSFIILGVLQNKL